MAAQSQYLMNKRRDEIRGTPYVHPTTVYIGLFSDTPTATNGTELSGGGYARIAVTCTSGNWTVVSDGRCDNTNLIAFANATSTWTVNGVGVWDAATMGNRLYQKANGSAQTVPIGSNYQFAAGALDFVFT